MTYYASNLPTEKHCFCGAEGGVSTGIYKGLNVNERSDDCRECLQKNMEIVAARVGVKASNLNLMCQGVSSHVEYVTEATQNQMTADGAVTDKKGVALCIRTADCAPVLLADYKNGIIGAAHAGWRGAFKGVVENTIALMLEKGATLENIAAAVGPCIAQKSYEVDQGFYDTFVHEDKNFAQYFINGVKSGFYQFDLEAFVGDKLRGCGVTNISLSGLDTYALSDDYYSFRRNTHKDLIKNPKCFPTEISTIVL